MWRAWLGLLVACGGGDEKPEKKPAKPVESAPLPAGPAPVALPALAPASRRFGSTG